MKLKNLRLLSAGMLLSVTVWAQQNINESDQAVIYKWYENGIAHYAKTPPYNNNNYTRLNEQGMPIKERPKLDASGNYKPLRPPVVTSDSESTTTKKEQQDVGSVEGVITREKRCEDARKNITMIAQRSTIYEEDEDGNLIPLSQEVIEDRLAKAKAVEARFCD